MTVPQIIIEIDQNGNVAVEVFHVQGPTCHELTAELEKALGKVTQAHNKPEYNALGQTQASRQSLGGGL